MYNLLSGHTRSCGCLTGKMTHGTRFGKLTLMSVAQPIHGMRYWNCRCDCGKELTVSIDTLAERAGISQQLYQYFESGKRSLKTCSFDTTCRVAAAFDYDIGEFFQNGCSFLKAENER